MMSRSSDRRIWRAAGVLGLALAGWSAGASAQSPPPAPAPEAAADPASYEDRLRNLEAMNQALLRQFQGVAKQNEELTRQVQELSKSMGGARPGAGGPAGGTGGPSNTRGTGLGRIANPADDRREEVRGGGPDGGVPARTGREDLPRPTTPNALQASNRPSRMPLDAFYDFDRFGYTFQSEDREFELRVNALLQVDSRNYTNHAQRPVISDIDVPRMRLFFSGRMTKPLEYQLSIQRNLNGLDVLNAYLNFHYDDRVQLRFGRYKAPFTYEWYRLSVQEFLAPERSLFALNFGANRQVGLMGWGFLFDEHLEYAAGIFDGGRNSFQDFNNAKDVMAFLDYRPFKSSRNLAIKNFSVGGSVDAGEEDNPLVPAVLRTSSNGSADAATGTSGNSNTSVPFLAFNNNVRERGERALWELHATYFYRGLSLLAAWDGGIDSYAQTTPGARPVPLGIDAYFVQAGYLITGESVERRGLVTPLRPFDIRRGKRGPGAIELTARISELDVSRKVFTAGLADPNQWANQAQLVDVGVNWYLRRYVKLMFDWEHAVFGQPVYAAPGVLQKTNDLFWVRLQLYF